MSDDGERIPKVRTSHHRNKEEAARLQTLVDKRLKADAMSDDRAKLSPALADFVRRCQAYLDDAPANGGHSDAAGSNAYELIEEAIEAVSGGLMQ